NTGLTAVEVYLEYQANKAKCGRKKIDLPASEKDYINEQIAKGWTPDVIIGRREIPISCGMRTLYRKFKSGEFNQENLPLQATTKSNGHQATSGRQSFRRNIRDRDQEHIHYQVDFCHLEDDTILGRHHTNAVITLVERQTKCIIAINPPGRQPA